MYWDNPADIYGATKEQAGPYSENSRGQYAFRTNDFELSPVRAATEGLITLRAPRRNAALLGSGNANVAEIFSTPWAVSPNAPKARAIPQFSYFPIEQDARAPFQYGELLTKEGKRLSYLEKTSLRQ